jgi:hypothetical protein
VLEQAGARHLVLYTGRPQELPGFEFLDEIVEITGVLVLGDFRGEALVADARIELPSQAAARISALFLRTIVIAERRRGESTRFANAEVDVDRANVLLSGIELNTSDIGEMLGGMP